MRIEGVPFEVIDWSRVTASEHAGATAGATWRTVERGNLRARIVEMRAGYLADHWCSRGHVVHVLAGAIETELQDGRSFRLAAGDTYVVAQDAEAHRTRSPAGARLLIVD
ncbi:MAG TPA: DHCW motif cupin fold protein [Candidatus Thermoplasmatota archaeon]|nr:DHCW motif cupin fold protein [Candidatus Thermoplasmatota archaeon]